MDVNAIGGINNFLGTLPVTSFTEGNKDTVGSFISHLKDAFEKVNQLQVDSKVMKDDFAKGKIDNIDQVMIMEEKADIVMQLTMQTRNKILDAYNEIMRMPI